MTTAWRYYIGAAILTSYLLLTHGAPLFAVIAGLAASAFLLFRRSSRPS